MGNHNSNSERTPLLQQLPPIPTVLDEEEQEEAQDIICDNHPHRRRRMLYRSSVLLLIISVLSALTFYSLRIYSNIESTVNESLEMTVRDIQFDGINSEDKSISLILNVDSSLNYSKAGFDSLTEKYLILNSYLVNNLNVDLDNINISVNTNDISNPIESVGVVKIEPFNLKVYQGVTDHLQLKVNIKPDSKAIFKVIKDVVMNKSMINMFGEFTLKVRLGYLRIPIKDIKLQFDNIVIDPSDLMNELYDHHLKLQELEISQSSIESSLSVISPHEDHPLLTRYISHIPSIPNSLYANLLMEGCDEKVFELMEFKMEGLSGFLDHINNNNLTISSLNSLPASLFEKCDKRGISPLSRLIQSIVYHKPKSNFLIKSSLKNNKLFPVWFNREVLDKIAIPYHIPTLSNSQMTTITGGGSTSLIQNVSIANLQLNVDNGIDKPQLGSGDIKFDIYIPLAIDLKEFHISNLKGLVDLKYQGEKFGYMDINKWLQCQTKDARSNCQLYKNDIIVTNPEAYGALIADYLMGADLTVEVDFVVDVMVDWKLVYERAFEVNGLHGSGRGGL